MLNLKLLVTGEIKAHCRANSGKIFMLSKGKIDSLTGAVVYTAVVHAPDFVSQDKQALLKTRIEARILQAKQIMRVPVNYSVIVYWYPNDGLYLLGGLLLVTITMLPGSIYFLGQVEELIQTSLNCLLESHVST